MMIDDITPVLIAFNEAPNIARTLDKLVWAKRIIIIDSGSDDGTLDITRAYRQVEVIHRPFDDCASQWNFANNQVEAGWVLSLDADYELSDAIVTEIRGLQPAPATSGYRAEFVYRIFGRPLRGSLYPSRIVLYRKEKAYYRNEGHTQQLVIGGTILGLAGVIFHDDRKPLTRWVASQRRYASDEVKYLLSSDRDSLSRVDRVRLMGWLAPLAVLIYTLFIKRCLLDGWPGWYYVLQRVFAETLIALEIIDRKLRRRTDTSLVR
jgi:glycosyltransferase involved in cell wall biosynthesis